jgi:hypothetical protein
VAPILVGVIRITGNSWSYLNGTTQSRHCRPRYRAEIEIQMGVRVPLQMKANETMYSCFSCDGHLSHCARQRYLCSLQMGYESRTCRLSRRNEWKPRTYGRRRPRLSGKARRRRRREDATRPRLSSRITHYEWKEERTGKEWTPRGGEATRGVEGRMLRLHWRY